MTSVGATLVACTKDGSVIESSYIGIEPATVDVEIPLYDEREIPINVRQTNETFANVIESITVYPNTVKVRQRINGGETLEGIDEIIVGEFDESALTGLRRNEKFTLPITLPDGYENLSGFNEVTVSVSYKSNTTVMAFNCQKIELENPDKLSYELKTASLEAYIRLPNTLALELAGSAVAFDNFVFEGSLDDLENGKIKVKLNVPDEYERDIYPVSEYYVEVDLKK